MLNDLYIEEGFKPDYITIDYLTLMGSSRVKSMAGLNTYSYYKLVAEEVHSLAKKLNIPIFSAVQLGRQAYGKADGSMADVADSIGIMQTASVVFFLHKSPELDAQGHMMINFVKNRNTGKLTSMLVGIDYQKMRFYDVSVNNCFTVNTEPAKGTSVGFDDIDEMNNMFGGF
jgi:replicative DNA helicase